MYNYNSTSLLLTIIHRAVLKRAIGTDFYLLRDWILFMLNKHMLQSKFDLAHLLL